MPSCSWSLSSCRLCTVYVGLVVSEMRARHLPAAESRTMRRHARYLSYLGEDMRSLVAMYARLYNRNVQLLTIFSFLAFAVMNAGEYSSVTLLK